MNKLDINNPAQVILIATLGSAALLGGAFIFQYLGYAPCKLCYWQRWPHGVAIAVGLLALAFKSYRAAAVMAMALFTTAALGVYHFGVEQKWWEGPNTCSGADADAELSAEQLLEQILAAPVVRCDEVAWQFIGISMAGWNVLASAALGLLCLCAAWNYQKTAK